MRIHGALVPDPADGHLTHYGSDLPGLRQLIAGQPALGEKLDPALEFLRAEVVWAARYELARTVEDVLARRVRLLFLDARAALRVAPLVAELLAREEGGRDDGA